MATALSMFKVSIRLNISLAAPSAVYGLSRAFGCTSRGLHTTQKIYHNGCLGCPRAPLSGEGATFEKYYRNVLQLGEGGAMKSLKGHKHSLLSTLLKISLPFDHVSKRILLPFNQVSRGYCCP
jgi:hypothetical protein